MYLARVAAYVQERLSKRNMACDVFLARASGKSLLDLGEVGARPYEGDIVNGRTMNTTGDLPHAKMAPAVPVLLPVCPIWASPYHKPSTKLKPLINGHCSHDFPSTSVSPDEEELLIEAVEKFGYAEWQVQEAASTEMGNTWLCLLEASAATPTKAGAKQRGSDSVINGTTYMTEPEHRPCPAEAPVLPTLSAARPLQANPYDKPSNEPKRSQPVPDLPLAPPSHPYMKARKDEEELLIEAVEEIEIAEWPAQDAVSTRIMSIAPYSPETKSAAIATSIAGQQIYAVVSGAIEGTLTPCSNEAERSACSTSGSPASPNNGLMPHKIISHNSNPSLKKACDDENKLLIEVAEELGCSSTRRHNQEVIGRRTMSMVMSSPCSTTDPSPSTTPVPCPVVGHQWPQPGPGLPFMKTLEGEEERPGEYIISRSQPRESLPLLVNSLPAHPILKPEVIHQWPEIDTSLPLMKNRGGEEKWPKQEAIGKTRDSTYLRLPESAVALPLPMPEWIGQPLAYLLPSSPAPKNWLRWKPPDQGEDTRQQLGCLLALWLIATYLTCRRLLAFISRCGSCLAIFDS
jgi:hypothetical protein